MTKITISSDKVIPFKNLDKDILFVHCGFTFIKVNPGAGTYTCNYKLEQKPFNAVDLGSGLGRMFHPETLVEPVLEAKFKV